jgi:hypothetical protein
MTILISLMSDTFLSKFQKKAERFGTRGGEDARYSDLVKQGRRWERRIRRLFRGRSEPIAEEDKDLESGQSPTTTGDDILREEILDEVQSIEESVDERVNESEVEDQKLAPVKEDVKEVDDDDVIGEGSTTGNTRRRRSKKHEDINIDEEDVERAIKEHRGELEEHED